MYEDFAGYLYEKIYLPPNLLQRYELFPWTCKILISVSTSIDATNYISNDQT